MTAVFTNRQPIHIARWILQYISRDANDEGNQTNLFGFPESLKLLLIPHGFKPMKLLVSTFRSILQLTCTRSNLRSGNPNKFLWLTW